MKVMSYDYEGEATVSCDNCNECYSIEFTGVKGTSIEEAVSTSLEEDGWENGCCPQCNEMEDFDGESEYDDNSD